MTFAGKMTCPTAIFATSSRDKRTNVGNETEALYGNGPPERKSGSQ